MSSIGSVSSYSSAVISGMGGRARPDPAKMAEDLFAQIDTKGQGYIEKSDLQSAFAQISSSSGSESSVSVDEVFGQLDGDGDGKVTQDEMTTSLKKLADELDSQFDQMRMAGGMGGPGGMPPAPPRDDAGFSKDELESQLDEIGSSDSKRSTLISSIVGNFDKADTDGDGKVSFKEAMAYDQTSQGSTTSSSTSSTSSTASSSSGSATSTDSSDLAVMKRIMELMHAYVGNESSRDSLLGALSVSA